MAEAQIIVRDGLRDSVNFIILISVNMNQTPPHRLNRFEKSIVITTQKTPSTKTYSVGALSPEKYQIEFFKTKYLNMLKE